MNFLTVNYWIKTECGQSKYAELIQKKGLFSKLRVLLLFV